VNEAVSLRSAAFAAVLVLGWSSAAASEPALPAPAPPIPIKIVAQRVDHFDSRDSAQRRFGAMEFVGGLVLKSSYEEFGGLSGLRLFPDGASFIAISDKGHWLRGRMVYENGRPAGVSNAEMAPALGPDGKPLWMRGWYDTESIAEDGGTLYVGIERVHRIVKFDYAKAGLLARGEPIAMPLGTEKLPANKSLEALAFIPRDRPGGGTLVAISERGLDAQGNLKAWLIGGATPGAFSVKRTGDFDVSDAAIIPGGDLVLLERRFSWLRGLAFRLRRIALADLKPGAVVDGPVLLFADLAYEIDNMEGLGIHRDAGGEIIFTLISDDNFSILQRTLLLQFKLVEGRP
jgi:hypothetical protein